MSRHGRGKKPLMNQLGLCGVCRFTWPWEEGVTKCPTCSVPFDGSDAYLVAVRICVGTLTEPLLFNQMQPVMQLQVRTPQMLADFLVHIQRAFNLEPQTDLEVVCIDVPDDRLRSVWCRFPDGHFEALNIMRAQLPTDTTGVMLIRDGHEQLYTAPCAPRLLLGWRAAAGDA